MTYYKNCKIGIVKGCDFRCWEHFEFKCLKVPEYNIIEFKSHNFEEGSDEEQLYLELSRVNHNFPIKLTALKELHKLGEHEDYERYKYLTVHDLQILSIGEQSFKE